MRPFFWIWAAVILAVLFVLSISPSEPGQSLCYSQTVFGVACPACGMGRAFHVLMHLQIGDAVRFNPLVLPTALFVIAIMTTSLLDAIRKTDTTRRLMRAKITWWAATLLAIVVGAVWIRNLMIY
jgi:hypothetical protein